MPGKLPGRVAIDEDVVFGRGGDRDLKCDVFTPPDSLEGGQQNRPAVLLLHGGGWRDGDKTQLKYYGIQLARYGYLCVCSEYRLSGEAIWPAQLHDAKAALRWIRGNAAQLNVDAARIAVSGNSAGAHLALMLAATPDTPGLEGDGGQEGVSSTCAAAIAVYPPTLLRSAEPEADGAVAALFGGPVSNETADAASPLTYAHRGFPPTMLVHGNADDVVPVAASLQMYDALSGAGAAVEMHIFQGQEHAFDTKPDFARQIADLSALFFERTLPATDA
jgi:acetyl esterase/lipase